MLPLKKLVALSLAVPFLAAVALSLPARTAGWGMDRANEIPDLSQTDPTLGLPNGGVNHCVPVAATNGVLWLANVRGFKRLVPIGDGRQAAAHIAQTLESADYMATNPDAGTTHNGFAQGLSRYVKEQGYQAQIKYQGRYRVNKKFNSTSTIPDYRWVTDSLRGDSVIWLSIGFYAHDNAHNEYTRISGHMVTMVGYGLDRNGKPERDTFIVHNTWSNRNGKAIQNEYLKVETLRNGWFTASDGARASDARDHMAIVDGMALPSGATIAIIDAAMVLEM